jgi:hypothetical protein
MFEFTLKKRRFILIADGFCVRQITTREGFEIYRMFWGTMRPGTSHPDYVNAFTDKSGEFVEFDELKDAIAWVNARRKPRAI